ncbi:unnamed protein product [Heterosigma akashiwo]
MAQRFAARAVLARRGMVFPWRERRSMWVNIYNTVAAPCAQVHFKEGYVGDVLTSTVRLLVDVAFGTLWFLAGVRGWLTADRLDLVAGGNFIEGLWLFQKFIVPALMAGPLYWRFMQNIHRAWATGDRWPHLGNAMKSPPARDRRPAGRLPPRAAAAPGLGLRLRVRHLLPVRLGHLHGLGPAPLEWFII